MNETMRKFGYPETLIKEYQSWVVLLRPAQATLGSLVLACKEDARAFSQLSPEAFAELHEITGQLEKTLHHAFSYDKINYLMLMMVDPDVHFHVIPRYKAPKEFQGCTFVDRGWPGVPDLAKGNESGPQLNQALIAHLKGTWG